MTEKFMEMLTATRRAVFVLTALLLSVAPLQAASDYKSSPEFLALRDSMHHAFNSGDSARFSTSVHRLERYLLEQNDMHAYYTQRCNEIVFELNRQNIFEAYMLSVRLSHELTERKLDKEMYMAINMMGHIYHFSGNNASAKRCFWEVIRMMEKEGYQESIPPIYMNLVNIVINEDPDEALRLIDQAASLARETSPEREFDIEARRTLAYYRMGDMERFEKGYQAYKEGKARGLSSVHGRALEVYHLTQQGRIDEAVKMANESIDDRFSTITEIYSSAGRWREAFEMQKKDMAETDSINSLLLSSSLQGIQTELERYELESEEARRHLYGVAAIATLLLLLVLALVYIVKTRQRHLREIRKAYQRALESDKMKTVFIENVSHEVRTPLNVISGFAQVMADPERNITPDERRYMSDMVVHNSNRITLMLDEVLMISAQESSANEEKEPVLCNEFLRNIIDQFHISGEKKNLVRLDFKTQLTDDQVVNTSKNVLRTIVFQLLDNAIKNTDKGSITLVASITGTQLMLAVEDTGIGVPTEQAEHIFERFVKLDPFKEGLGIGLSFCRTMVQRIGGNVYLDQSYTGTGARFVLTLPL
jgi:signal transduction histidine kinase